jgi:hypothetical protein
VASQLVVNNQRLLRSSSLISARRYVPKQHFQVCTGGAQSGGNSQSSPSRQGLPRASHFTLRRTSLH